MSKEKALAKQEAPSTTALAHMMEDFAADSGSGFEETNSSSFAIPMLKLLAAMSKQCKKGTAEYIKGAEEVREVVTLQDVTNARQAEEELVDLRAAMDARTGRGGRDPFAR